MLARNTPAARCSSAKEDGVGAGHLQPAREAQRHVGRDVAGAWARSSTSSREDQSVRWSILTGAGNKAFVSGADISQFEQAALQRRRAAGIRPAHQRRAATSCRVSEADHRPHPRLLPGRRARHRDAGGSPHRRDRQPVRHSGREARHRLRLRHGAQPGLAGRPGARAHDPVHRRALSTPPRRSGSGWSTRWCRTRSCPTRCVDIARDHRRQRAALGRGVQARRSRQVLRDPGRARLGGDRARASPPASTAPTTAKAAPRSWRSARRGSRAGRRLSASFPASSGAKERKPGAKPGFQFDRRDQAPFLRTRRAMPSPVRPAPSSSSEAGSGTGVDTSTCDVERRLIE